MNNHDTTLEIDGIGEFPAMIKWTTYEDLVSGGLIDVQEATIYIGAQSVDLPLDQSSKDIFVAEILASIQADNESAAVSNYESRQLAIAELEVA